MAEKNKKNDKPYILMKAVGALTTYKKVDEKEAFRQATQVLQAVGLLRPGTHELTRFGKKLERSLKISRARRKKDG